MESLPQNIPQSKPLDQIKETFETRLNAILHKELTPDNIETFADEALKETIKLTDDLLEEYKNNPSLEANPSLSEKEREDDAYKKIGLPNIPEILDSIIEVKEKIERLNLYLTQKVSKKSKVITPPDSLEQTIRPAEEGQKLEEMRIFPRLLTLMYILEHDFEIEPEEVSIIEGEVTPEMMRKSPYYRVKIDGLNRIVYICDEEGNASYVFDLEIIKENNLDIDEIDLDSKEARNALIAKYPGIGIRIIQSKNWRHNISEMLENPLPQNDSEESAGSQKSRESEFKREKRKYLPFEDFQKEVREFYPGGIGVVQWYLTEYKKHEGWPASPEKTYEGKGWEGRSKLVGKEKRKRKGELLPFEEFRGEVIRAYPGKVGVLRWYKREQKNHKNWPSEPTRTYKDNWIGWPELVGIENRLKREFLSFENFKDAVRSAYPGDRNVQNWYMTEYKNHKGWPANPQRTYKNNWVGWSELVDKAK